MICHEMLTHFKNHVLVQVPGLCGGMAERLKAHVLKTCLGHTNVGSNPTPSASSDDLSRPEYERLHLS